jgi:phage terminase large subunit-like protein
LTVPIFQSEALFFGNHIETQQNELMSWQMGNVVLIYEDGDHCRISKKKSPEKIDGVAAMLNAFHSYMVSYSEQERLNIFDLINARLLVK